MTYDGEENLTKRNFVNLFDDNNDGRLSPLDGLTGRYEEHGPYSFSAQGLEVGVPGGQFTLTGADYLV